DIAVADAHALVGRLDGELVPAARVALLVVVQALEAGVERRVRLRLLSARDRRAATGPRGEADRPVVRVGPLVVVTGREFILDDAARARRSEVTRLRGARPAERTLPPPRRGARSGPHGERGDDHDSKAETLKDAHPQLSFLVPDLVLAKSLHCHRVSATNTEDSSARVPQAPDQPGRPRRDR